jgi:hypothetical protein
LPALAYSSVSGATADISGWSFLIVYEYNDLAACGASSGLSTSSVESAATTTATNALVTARYERSIAQPALVDRELAGCSLADERLNKRLRKLLAKIGSAMGQSIPLVCQDWANTKGGLSLFLQ